MARKPAREGREPARTEQLAPHVQLFERTPLIPLPADARLRPWLVGDYGGFYDASFPHAPVLPATLVTPLVVDVSCWQSPEVTHAWHLLVRSRGKGPISEIARQVNWSHKHLIAKFKQQIGVTPRLAARLLRLSMVWRHLDDGQSWARIAAECGYTDQAHLIREFRRLAGTTPAALTTG